MSHTWTPPDGSWASSEPIRRTMLACRNRDTSPEKAVRSAVHALGLRFRVAARPLPELRRTADLVFRSAKVAVHVDGCWWHGCPDHSKPAKTNVAYWHPKIERNKARDADTDRRLADAGWLSLRYWEHDDPVWVARDVATVVRTRLETPIRSTGFRANQM